MTIRHVMIAGLGALALLASACSEATSSASGDGPLPTIGLGTPGLPGQVTGAADVRLIEAGAIDTVVMIGDSITVASTPALQDAFERVGFDNIVIESKEGKRTAVSFGTNPSGTSVAEYLVGLGENPTSDPSSDPANSTVFDGDHSNELWVIALGTNDINQYGPAELAAAFNEMLSIVPDESPLIWVDTYYRDQSDGAAEVNAIIEDRVSQRGNATVARWSEVAADEGNLTIDGVHPREAGSVVFASTITDTIIQFLQLG